MNLLITGAFDLTDIYRKKIENIGYNITFIQNEMTKLNIDLQFFDAVICNQLFLYNNIEIFENLKLIHTTSSGLDRLPLEKIKKKNIQVYSAKGVYSVPISEWVILKILEIYKMSKFFYDNQNKQEWNKNRKIDEIFGKTACIIGYGNIGKEVAKRLSPFGVHIINVGRSNRCNEYSTEHISLRNIKEALIKSDIVILTSPLTDDTYKLIRDDTLSSFKEESILVNVSRGALIDEKALSNHLKNGHLKYAALDVFVEEPLPSESELWSLNTIITPHNSFQSKKNIDRLQALIYNNLLNFKEGVL